jgi:hypothetical protein
MYFERETFEDKSIIYLIDTLNCFQIKAVEIPELVIILQRIKLKEIDKENMDKLNFMKELI